MNKQEFKDITRKVRPSGIQWNGFLYEPVVKLAAPRVMILEDHGEHLLVSEYTRTLLHGCKPVGEPVRVLKIGEGKKPSYRTK